MPRRICICSRIRRRVNRCVRRFTRRRARPKLWRGQTHPRRQGEGKGEPQWHQRACIVQQLHESPRHHCVGKLACMAEAKVSREENCLPCAVCEAER